MPNIWCVILVLEVFTSLTFYTLIPRHMCHDPTVYHDPFEFKPERFLGMTVVLQRGILEILAFGFGRRYVEKSSSLVHLSMSGRICPGKELADPSLFLSVAMTLAVFDITKSKDAKGCEVEPRYEYTPGVIS